MSKSFFPVLLLALGSIFVALVHAEDAKPADNGERVFELRTYTTPAGKLDALNARFRDHTCKLFIKHGMTLIGFWTPSTGPTAENTLIYLLAFPNKEAQKKSWEDFRADPDWIKAKAESEANGKLTDKVESLLLKPTDYSPLK